MSTKIVAPAALAEPSHKDLSAEPHKPKIDPRYVAPVFITVILLVASLFYHVLESFPQTLTAIGCSIATEIVLGLLVYKKFPHLASAYVSGISVGILVRSPMFWPYAVCAIISILSKYVIRVKNRHLWNPSNFGIAVMLLLAPGAMSTLGVQWGNSLWPMLVVWTLGAVIVSRLNRLHICATYVASFFAFALLRGIGFDLFQNPFHQPLMAFINGEIAPITGPMYQLFIFFMMTDPKSTTLTRRGQIATAFSVAAMECVLRLFHNIHAPYYALFLVGPTANLIEIARSSRHPLKPQSSSVSVAA